MTVNYLIGDATQPQGEGVKFICHISNDLGGWGAGFVIALSNRWPQPEQEYRKLKPQELILGNVQLVQVTTDIYVINMIAQSGFMSYNNLVPVKYDALKECLDKVRTFALLFKATVHMPRIGAGLGGGDWNTIEKIIQTSLFDVDTFVYDLK
jgi:O-acetyl-ADP-ribose deacetylase (regulator of RNase III)